MMVLVVVIATVAALLVAFALPAGPDAGPRKHAVETIDLYHELDGGTR